MEQPPESINNKSESHLDTLIKQAIQEVPLPESLRTRASGAEEVSVYERAYSDELKNHIQAFIDMALSFKQAFEETATDMNDGHKEIREEYIRTIVEHDNPERRAELETILRERAQELDTTVNKRLAEDMHRIRNKLSGDLRALGISEAAAQEIVDEVMKPKLKAI